MQMVTARKQLEIPGAERAVVAEVEAAADAYRETVASRMALQKREETEKQTLITAMRNHGLKQYEYPDDEGVQLTVKLKRTTKVSVRKSKKAEVEDDSDDGDDDEGTIQ